MTENRHGAIWVRANELERLFSAPRICYLVGGYDGSGNYGDILQLHANIERLQAAGDDILAAPMVYWKHLDDHAALHDEQPWLFGDSCFLYYVPAAELDKAAATLGDEQLVTIPDPPQTFSQIVVYGGGFLNSWWGWGAHKLSLIDLVATWLDGVSPDSYPLAIVGQQISNNFLESPHAEQFATMLDHASMIGVRDELSLENLKRWNDSDNVGNAVVSGDDATLPIVTARDDHRHWAPSDLDDAQQSADLTVVNIHLNTANYVTNQPHKQLRAFEAIVRRLRRVAGDALNVNLLIAYEDSRISETRIVDQLKASPALNNCTVNVLSCIDELHHGFPNISRAQLTVCCSYHVALTSLFLGIPTAFAVSNDYYSHKAEGLKRAFHLPDEMLLDIQHDSPDTFSAVLERALRDQSYRARISEGVAQGATSMLLRSTVTSTALTKFMAAKYVANREDRYQATAARLLDTTEQLSDLRLEYSRLLNIATKLSAATRAKPQPAQAAATGYEKTVRDVKTAIQEQLPAKAKVLVVSRGDDELVQLSGRTGWHFPQSPSGVYAGHHPAGSAAAVEHLTNLRAKGAEYLVFPNTAFWWLDYYSEFAQHLNQNHRKISSGPQCIIYQLSKPQALPAPGSREGQLKSVSAVANANGARRTRMEPDPIIVYGPPRSGTSYLIHILNKHPDIFITPETRVFVWAHRTLNEETQEFFSVFKHREQFIAYLQGKYPDLIRDYYLELNPEARYWGDKNPHYASPDCEGSLQTIHELFPGTKFINIIRDGRGNVASMMKKKWANFGNAHKSWLGHLEVGCAFGRALPKEQYFELHYDDLIRDDTAMARRIFDFLQIEIHPNVVKFCDAQQVKRSPINQPERDLSGDLTKSDWDTMLTPELKLRSLDLLGEQLIAHGFETRASLDQIRNDLLQEAPTPSLAGTVRDVIRGALPVGGNGTGRRFGIIKRETD